MKNSFFLVIPVQQKAPDLLEFYEKTAVEQWISDLPTANPGLVTRLFNDFIEGFNRVQIPAQQRLDILEQLRPEFLTIEDYLRSRLIRSGFPKGDADKKTLIFLIAIQKQFTISYWTAVQELTRRSVGWLQGKSVALAIQRTIKGLSSLVITHYMMFLTVPDWVWIDLHSLYKLSVKIKKEATKIANKTSTVESCYKQVLLLSLTDPSGLMQKEVQQVYDFIEKTANLVSIEKKPVTDQKRQCIVLMDEDTQPFFDHTGHSADSAIMYLNLSKLYKLFKQKDKFINKNEARFSSLDIIKNSSEKLPEGLFNYLQQCWQGVELKGNTSFSDRLNRYIAIGLDATHLLQNSLNVSANNKIEFLAESFSIRELSCQFNQDGQLSIGSLISFRNINDQVGKRALGVIKKITMPKQDGQIIFELSSLASQSYAVTYNNIDAFSGVREPNKALLYGIKDEKGERSFIITESFMHKDDDIMRMFMHGESFIIILGNRKNIGLGYWQFECRRIEEKQLLQAQAQAQLKKKRE